MKILDTNKKFILVSQNQRKLYLLGVQTFQILHSKQFEQKTDIKVASLQYGTGIAAICTGSKVFVYDFLYERQVYQLQTYKVILKVCIRKNLLIVVSQDRILVHNLDKKENELYIHTLNGKLVFLDEDYFRLSIFYPEDHEVIASKPIWSKKGWKNNNGIKYQKGCYFQLSSKIALSLENTLSFYQEGEMLKVYGFDSKIVEVKSIQNPKLVFVLLENNEIISQNLTEQFRYAFEDIEQNRLVLMQKSCEEKNQKPQKYFWIENGWIYYWNRLENENGKLLKASISQPILIDKSSLMNSGKMTYFESVNQVKHEQEMETSPH